jgi:hypothetical protein
MNHTALLATGREQAADTTRSSESELLPVGFDLTRSNVGGPFAVFERGALRIDAEAGTVIRVHAGCLWVPDDEEECSVGVGAGEQIRIRNAGLITTLAMRATQVELVWPEAAGDTGPVQHAD